MKKGYTWLIILFCTVFVHLIHAQKEAPSWVEFAKLKELGLLSGATLSDYSYTGYHFSEKEIPDVSTWNTISVTDFGAVANDEGYDDAGIQSAIDAAVASGQPTVVYFPAGRYKVASTATENTPIVINGNHIVLKGAGSGNGGTEIYTDKFGNKPWRFHFKPSNVSSSDITKVTAEIKRGDFEIEVANASNLSVGQTIDLFQHTKANLEANMPGLPYKAVWRIGNNGIRPYEKHLITAISGNKVTFKNPVQLNMPLDNSTVLKTHKTIEEVGVEDILFTSGWKHYPDDYKHHADDIVDYAWRALTFENVKNGWIKDCHFKDWNEALQIEKSIAVTIKDIEVSGKKGHTSYFSRYSYGILFENCVDNAKEGLSLDDVPGMGHGPGMRWSTTSTVFLNCGMQKHQSIDCHGYHPYGNLLDNVYGGTIRGNGGAENSYPNSGPYMSFWNFKHWARYSNKTFDFWDHVNRKTHTYAQPIFVGFQTTEPRENITFVNEKLDELHGQQVYPNSLFEAQLQLRLYSSYVSASSHKSEKGIARFANDGIDSTLWVSATNDMEGAWLILDLGEVEEISTFEIDEPAYTINDWKLEFADGDNWYELTSGDGIGEDKTIAVPTINTRRLRFTVLSLTAEESVGISQISASSVIGPAINLLKPQKNSTLPVDYSNFSVKAFITDDNGSIDEATLYMDDIAIRTITTDVYEWGGSGYENELLGLEVGEHTFKIIAVDNEGNKGNESFKMWVEESNGIERIVPGGFRVYPNPAKETFTIESNSTHPISVRIFNMLGEKVYESSISEQEVRINTRSTDLKRGLYLIEFSAPDSKKQSLILSIE